MTDPATPIDMPAPNDPPAPPVKPGWRTTEFWLSLGAFLLTALYASGILPTTGAAAAIAAMAATVLTALGYKVSRTLVKLAGIALLITGLGVLAPACGSPRETAAIGVAAGIDCESANLKAAAAELVPMATQAILWLVRGTGHVDTAAFLAALGQVKSDAGRCAVATAVAILTAPSSAPSPAAITAGAPPIDAAELRAAFEATRASWGGASYRTAHGTI